MTAAARPGRGGSSEAGLPAVMRDILAARVAGWARSSVDARDAPSSSYAAPRSEILRRSAVRRLARCVLGHARVR
jgi:hypothetical protein